MELAELWCCVDCLHVEANGISSLDWSEEREAKYWVDREEMRGDVVRYTLGLIYGAGDCECSDIDNDDHYQCETVDFSWNICHLCGSGLGGSRHAVTGWFE